MEASQPLRALPWRNNQIKPTLYNETKKKANDSQIVRGKEDPKLSLGRLSYREASGTNPQIKALPQSRY